jgi:hypothetical protein
MICHKKPALSHHVAEIPRLHRSLRLIEMSQAQVSNSGIVCILHGLDDPQKGSQQKWELKYYLVMTNIAMENHHAFNR